MIGKTVSHYKIIEEIGAGGMGVVYKAEDTKLNRIVALKFLPPELTRDPEAKSRFIREARAASSLQHNNICTIHEIDETNDGQMYICMDYYEGKTLKQKLTDGPLPVDQAINIATQIAQGLLRAREEGIVHRDIKPANIIITDRSEVKILDFGLAKLAGQAQLTKDTSTLGTVAYMSPEQVSGKQVDQRTDIWSLGVVLYEMLTGQLPFKGEYEQAIVYAILNEEPKYKGKSIKSIPAPLILLLEKSLSKDHSLRTNSISKFKTGLEQISAQISGMKRTGRINRYLRPTIFVPTGLVILIVAAYLVYNTHRMDRIRWAKDVALPKIEQLISSGGTGVNNIEAFDLARKAEKYIPDDPMLNRYKEQISGIITIKTQPAGVKIFQKPFNKTESEWEYIGVSPIDSMVMPKYLFNWKFEKPGFDILYRQFWSRGSLDWSTFKYRAGTQECIMEKEGVRPKSMVQIPRTENIPIFFIDKYEVTNKQYKQFMDNRGYQNKTYWKIPFIKNNKEISWEEAISEFRDATGRLGPVMWEGGSYPEGEDDMPISGVSWYEAAAYAEFAGKSLPTVDHWGAARMGSLGMFYHLLFPMCNFSGKGPVPIGTTEAITQFGIYDMAGNVREWCWNETEKGRCIRGGAWNDVHYMYSSITQADPFDRSLKNGRAVVYPVYKGTFERQDGLPGSLHYRHDKSHEYKDYVVKIVKDFKRVIDYLETRPDIDVEKIAYFGVSWGGIMGSIIPAVEERIKIAIIDAGGLKPFEQKAKPEVDPINYVSRVTIPTLMLHGRFDTNVSFDKAAKPMFDLLGTNEKHKKLIVYETDHIIPRKELIKESLDWLDQYFGVVK